MDLKLKKETITKGPNNKNYMLSLVGLENHHLYIDDLELIINYIKQQLIWDGIPTLEECLNRFNLNSTCYLFYYKYDCIGWVWVDNTSIDTELYLYNFYVVHRSIKNRPKESGLHLYHMISDKFTEHFDLLVQVDDWHKHSINLFKKVGYIEYE